MPTVQFQGALPATMPENAQRGGWAGALTMAIPPQTVRAVDVIGNADLFLDSSFDSSTGTVSLWNVATPDYEGFARIAAQPVISFQLRLFMQDGTQSLSAQSYSVAIGDVDDTPPIGLRFASGGQVAPGDIAATIGQLAVTDPDSAGPWMFTIDEADAWMYEVVGSTLKLKPGMAVSISDGPFRALNIEVSDGLQSSAFRLDIRVEAPDGQQAVLDVLDPWEMKAGFSYKSAESIRAYRGGWELDSLEHYGSALINVRMKDDASVWVQPTRFLEFFNGVLDMREGGSADMVSAAYQAILGRSVERFTMWSLVEQMDTGRLSLTTLATNLITSAEYRANFGTLNNDQFARMLYRHAEGGTPSESGVLGWKIALDTGTSRLTVAMSFVEWEVNLAQVDAQHPNGYWLDRPYGAQVGALYDVAFNRLPDPIGFEGWVGWLNSGRFQLGELARLFGQSDEFRSRYASVSNADFVRDLYLSALDREPDQGGFDFWVGHLNRGTLARHDMVQGFAFSTEKALMMAALPAGDPFF